MPGTHKRNASQQVLVELVEADVEIGFNLVETARECRRDNPTFSLQALQQAEEILLDIEQRLARLGELESVPFRPLVEELRREIEAAGGEHGHVGGL